MAEKNDLTPEQLETAGVVDKIVVSFLRTRYLTAFTVLGILTPILGLIVGAAIESKLFTASRDRILDDAKAEVADEVQKATDAADQAEARIRETSDRARDYLDEIRSTREAMDFVLRGTPTGELALLQKRSAEVEEAVEEFTKQLEKWEGELEAEIPQGLVELDASKERMIRLKESVERLDALFKSNETNAAGALAGAFYKIYELLGEFELSLYVPRTSNAKDLELIAAEAGAIQASVEFYRGDDRSEDRILSWSGLTPKITWPEIADVPEKIGDVGKPTDIALNFRFTLADNPSWWRIADAGEDTIKTVDLQDCADFDTVKVVFTFPLASAVAQDKLAKCHLSDLLSPRYLKINANVNRVVLGLEHVNDLETVTKTPFFGRLESIAAAPAQAAVAAAENVEAREAVPEQAGTVTFLFSGTSLFSAASAKYTSGLDRNGSE